jgi:hypothetical protein
MAFLQMQGKERRDAENAEVSQRRDKLESKLIKRNARPQQALAAPRPRLGKLLFVAFA